MTDFATNIETLQEFAREIFEDAGNPDSPFGNYEFLLSTLETDRLTEGDAYPVRTMGRSNRELDYTQDVFSFCYDVVERRHGLNGSNDGEIQMAAHGLAYFLTQKIAAQRLQIGVPTNG